MATDLAHVASYHDDLIERYGHTPEGADASSREALEVRWQALAEVCDLDGKSVLEVGCGMGDLGAYLTVRYPGIRYHGIDISDRAVLEARRSYPGLSFENAALHEHEGEYDVVLAQGIFYKLGPDASAISRSMIRRMWRMAKEAVAFTAISTWSERRDEGEYRVDPVRLLNWVRKDLTRRVVVRHDYHLGDVCFYLYREPGRGAAE